MAVEQVITIDTTLIDISNIAQIERRMPKETEVVIVNINPGERGLRIIIARNENQECLKLQKKISLFNRRDKC
jgi:aspartate 1-decarboxylase